MPSARLTPEQLESRDDLMFRNPLNSIVENAQLAALEVTDFWTFRRCPRCSNWSANRSTGRARCRAAFRGMLRGEVRPRAT